MDNLIFNFRRKGGRINISLFLTFFLVTTFLQLSSVSSLSNNFAYDYLNHPQGNNITYINTTIINSTGGGNPFDQSLNTTDNVTFNSINITDGTNGIFTDYLDLTGVGAGLIPRLNGFSSLYNILTLKNGIIVDWDESFPYWTLLFYDNNDDGNPENEVALTFNAGTQTAKFEDVMGGANLNLEVEGNLYEQSDDRVCTVENGLCTGTDWNSTGLIQDYNGTGLIKNWSAVISGGDNLWTNVSNVATSVTPNVAITNNLTTTGHFKEYYQGGIVYHASY